MDQKSQGKFLKKYMELSESKNTAHQNLWDTAKAVLSGECVALNALKEENLTSQ